MGKFILSPNGDSETLRSIAIASGVSSGCAFVYAEFRGLRFLLGAYARLFEADPAQRNFQRKYPKAAIYIRFGADSTSIVGDEDDLASFYKIQSCKVV